MSEHTKNRWQKRRRHGTHDGDISGAFCGRRFKARCAMAQNPCMKNPTRDCNTARRGKTSLHKKGTNHDECVEDRFQLGVMWRTLCDSFMA